MGKSLIIVESPAKAKTINKFLGKNYKVKASLGHVRDLPKNPKKKGDADWIGVDEDRDFHPHYVILKEKQKAVDEILASAREADSILLAADPDREGEAICWHIAEILRTKKIDKPIQRILFNEITRRAVQSAIEHPRAIIDSKVDAQEARRILDRIVGYRVSPLLWDKVRRGLSAGRVQTVALRMIVEREREIRDFQAIEYWTVTARLEPEGRARLDAKLVCWRDVDVPWRKNGGEQKQPGLPNEAAALEVVEHCRNAAFRVESIESKASRRNPAPPFTTSKLQQEASRKFRLPVARTMRLAQNLYEGKDVGTDGTVGLITYMRTDSVRVADEALDAVRSYIGSSYGAEYLPESPRTFRQSKSAQDAHEAIRPTSLELPPDKVAQHLDADELKIYTLIWNRFVASQMNAAEFDVTRVDIRAGEALFRATGEVLRFPGWLAVYQETREDDAENGGSDEQRSLPALNEGEALGLDELTPAQNFTQPPPRFTEAMLVRALEENGIGRPSTYAAILGVLADKDYVDKVEGRLKPNQLGELVCDLLVKHFGDIFEIPYTARLEEELDKVEEGEKGRVETLRDFASKFRVDLERARKEMENVKKRAEKTDIPCDQCGAMMVKRWGRFGEFLACERYPECKNTKDLHEDKPLPDVDETCPNCGKPMTLRRGKWGPFLACTGYPECKTTRKIRVQGGAVEVRKEVVLEEKCPQCGRPLARKQGRFGEYIGCTGYPECRYTHQEETGVACPKCGKPVVVRRSRRGTNLYGCSGYPECDFVVWKRPVPSPCPKCGRPYRLESITKRYGRQLICDNEACGHKESVPEETPAAVS
ncbi:MAG: type I DNA topoisomerase [Acidobacteria bacterium]|nr:type I DNA topoisomerase [Acidobacteriota bacterium]